MNADDPNNDLDVDEPDFVPWGGWAAAGWGLAVGPAHLAGLPGIPAGYEEKPPSPTPTHSFKKEAAAAAARWKAMTPHERRRNEWKAAGLTRHRIKDATLREGKANIAAGRAAPSAEKKENEEGAMADVDVERPPEGASGDKPSK